MKSEHEIVALVNMAKTDSDISDRLIRQYLPFIKSEVTKHLRRAPIEGHDDELGIAMFAFHEATKAYNSERGSFFALAAKMIRNRLIDYRRRERRHDGILSLDHREDDDSPSLLDTLDSGYDHIGEHETRSATREEIAHFAADLSGLGLSLSDIAENCPKQARTLDACRRALDFARANPELLEQLRTSGKVPISALAYGSGVEAKTLERHRRYLAAIMLAYTNGFEIIRGHLNSVIVRGGSK